MENNSRPPPPQPPVVGYPPPGYPYNAPPLGAVYPFYVPPPQQPPRPTFLCRFMAVILGFFLIFTTISFITFLILRPTSPQFSLKSLAVSNLTLSSETMTGNWDVRFSVSNPNKKMSISYDNMEAYVYYGRAFLMETTMTPFVQGIKNQTEVTAMFGARGTYVGAGAVREMNGDMRDDEVVRVDVRVLARVKFINGGWEMRRRLLRVLCQDVNVKLTNSSGGSSGNLLIGNYACLVGF